MNEKNLKKNSVAISRISSFVFTGLLTFISVNFVYAADLPSPVGGVDLWGFINLIITLILQWFVFPALVFFWFYVGFLFVKAQGNPQELREAKSWLWWTLIGTVIIMLAQGFSMALQGTVAKIFS